MAKVSRSRKLFIIYLLGAHCNIFMHYVLFAPRLNLFSREGSPRIRPPSGSEIRPVPQLIRHLIGNVWAQYRGMRRTCKRILRASTRVRMGFKANYEISHGHWQRPPLFARPRVSRA